MAVDERRRIELFERLADSVGEEAARTLFDLLPPPGRDVASSADVADLRRDMDVRFDHVDARFDHMEQGFEARFEQVDARFELIEERLGRIEQRADQRAGEMEERLEGRFELMEHRFQERFAHLEAAFERRIGDAITAQTRTIIFGLLGALALIGGYAASLARFAG